MSSSVAIVLVNWNSFDFTNDCINSLKKVTYSNFSIIVVDNGSKDGSGQKLQEAHSGVLVLFSPENKGFTGGNNLGLAYAIQNGFEYVMMLNNDTFVEPNFLVYLVQHLDHHPTTGAVQSRIYFNHNRALLWNGGTGFNQFTGWPFTHGEGKLARPFHLKTKEIAWITGCAFMVRTSILKQTGLLAENMFIYGEDVDLSFRIKKLGYSLTYIPASIVYHIAGSSNKKKIKDKEGIVNPIVHYLNFRNLVWIQKKYTAWYFVPTVLLYNFFYTTLIMGYFAIRLRPKKLKAVFNGVKDGIKGSIKYD